MFAFLWKMFQALIHFLKVISLIYPEAEWALRISLMVSHSSPARSWNHHFVQFTWTWVLSQHFIIKDLYTLDRRNYWAQSIPRGSLPCPPVPGAAAVPAQRGCAAGAAPAGLCRAGPAGSALLALGCPDLRGTAAWHSRRFVRNDPLCSQSLTIPLLSRIRFEFSPVSPKDHLPRHKSVCSYWPRAAEPAQPLHPARGARAGARHGPPCSGLVLVLSPVRAALLPAACAGWSLPRLAVFLQSFPRTASPKSPWSCRLLQYLYSNCF